MPWQDWSIELHEQEEQQKRLERSVDVRLFNGIICCTSHGYIVSLDWCTCFDFTMRLLPCKHIYARAKQLGKLVVTSTIARSSDLLVNIKEKYSTDWAFVIGKHNYSNLDIIYNAQSGKYQQGTNFCFHEGELFYDNEKAYLAWGDAEFGVCLQVLDCTPNYRHYSFRKENDILYATLDVSYGTTRFKAYHGKCSESTVHSCKNNEFVNLLRYGKFTDLSGRSLTKDEL